MVIHKCKRCEFEGKGRSHLAAEMAYDAHECRNADGSLMRDLREMPSDLLGRLARKELTEAEAWALVDRRALGDEA